MITVRQAIVLCFLLAALIRIPGEPGPRGAVTAMYLLIVAVLVYLLWSGVVR
jgi:hypothetical protein